MNIANNNVQKIRLMPAWLCFWLCVYLINLPGQITLNWAPLILDVFSGHYTFSVQMGLSTPFFEMMRFTNLIELLPFLVVFAGVLLIFFPRLRGWFTERSYKLKPMDDLAVVQEIRAFVEPYVPGVVVRVNMLDWKKFATAYPLGFRKPALGIFGGLVKLWRADREAAEAILLHEIAHFRSGDALIMGAGSLFEWTVRNWVWCFLVLVFIPLMLFSGAEIVESWTRAKALGVFTLGGFVVDTLLILLSAVVSSFAELLMTFAVFTLPLFAIWSAELNADRFALETTRSSETMKRVLAYLSPSQSWWKRLLFSATHPPAWLRGLLSVRYQSWWALVLIYPLGYGVKILVQLVGTMPLLLLSSWESMVETFNSVMNITGNSLIPLFIGMALFLLAWPLISTFWPMMFTRQTASIDVKGYPVYGLSAVALLLSVFWISNAVQPEPPDDFVIEPIGSESHYKIGQIIPAGGSRVLILDWEITADDPVLEEAANKDKALARIDLNVLNAGDEFVHIPLNARLRDSHGKEYYYSINDAENRLLLDRDTPTDRLMPGERVRGRLSFLVDKDAGELQFIFIHNPPADMSRAIVPLSNDPSARITPPETLPEEQIESEVQAGEKASVKGLTITVDEVAVVQEPLVPPEAGMQYVIVRMTVENTGKKDYDVSQVFLMNVKDQDERVYDMKPMAVIASGEGLTDQNIAPGQMGNLLVGFQVPLETESLQFLYEFGSEKIAIDLGKP